MFLIKNIGEFIVKKYT